LLSDVTVEMNDSAFIHSAAAMAVEAVKH
jgi:hypothetical protein